MHFLSNGRIGRETILPTTTFISSGLQIRRIIPSSKKRSFFLFLKRLKVSWILGSPKIILSYTIMMWTGKEIGPNLFSLFIFLAIQKITRVILVYFPSSIQVGMNLKQMLDRLLFCLDTTNKKPRTEN